jgi:hypothetical protein
MLRPKPAAHRSQNGKESDTVASLDDSDADAFFRQGDEGTYSGGPSDSIPTGVVNVFDDLEEDALPRLTKEQVERRDRYTRWVTGLVGALGVSAMLAVGVHAVGSDDTPKTAVPVAVPVRAAAAPAAPQAPRIEAEPVEAIVAAPPPAGVKPTAEVEPVTTAKPTAEAEPVTTAKPAQPSDDTPRREKASSAARNAVRVHRTPPPAVTAARTTPLPSLGHSSPPTAYFPD